MISDEDLRTSIERRERNLAEFVGQAGYSLATGDYSAAATWSHRAHQEQLVLGALRYTLTGVHGVEPA